MSTRNFIWSYEDLSQLSQHKNLIVREWSIERLGVMYPEDCGDVMIRALEDKERTIALTAAEHFVKYPNPKYKRRLLEIYESTTGELAGDIAIALSKLGDDLLIKTFKIKYQNIKSDPSGYVKSVFAIGLLKTEESRKIVETALRDILTIEGYLEHIHTLFWCSLLTGISVQDLVNFCLVHPEDEKMFFVFLKVLSDYCNSWDNLEEVDNEPKPIELKAEIIDYLRRRGYKGLADKIVGYYNSSEYEGIIEELYQATDNVIQMRKKEVGEDIYRIWEMGRGRPRQNIAAILAFYNTFKASPVNLKPYIVRVALGIFAMLVECKNLIGINIKDIDFNTAIRLFCDNRGNVEEDAEIIEKILNSDRKTEIIEVCLASLKDNPDSPANIRIVELLDRMRIPDILEQLFMIESDDPYLWERIVELGVNAGPGVIEWLRPILAGSDEDKVSDCLRILKDLPIAESTDIILEHWDKLWRDNKKELLEAIRGIGDRRFITPLKSELKPDEFKEAEVYYLLCLINRVADPQLKEIESKLMLADKKLLAFAQAVKEGDTESIIKDGVSVELKCLSCYKSYHYTIKEFMIEDKTGEFYIDEVIRCKNCGKADNYEITEEGNLGIISFVSLISTMKRRTKELPFSSFRLAPIYGKKMTMQEAKKFYEELLNENPANLEYLIGYANLLRKIKRTGDAVFYYKKAILFDPCAIEGFFNLGEIAEADGDYKTAYEYFKKAYEIIDNAHYYKFSGDQDMYKESILDSLSRLEDRLGMSPARPTKLEGQVLKYPKVGRNDPCPCGSGKKFKKCCMLKDVTPIPAVENEFDRTKKRLIQRLQDYTKDRRFHNDYINASAIYWHIEPVEPLRLPPEVLEDRGEFMEWFILDFPTASGATIPEMYYSEMANEISRQEKRMLEAFIRSYQSLYEILDVTGNRVSLKELFTGKELQMNEPRLSAKVVKWDIVFLRVCLIDEIYLPLSAEFIIIPRNEKEDLIDFLRREFERFKGETGVSDWSQFMKKRAYLVSRHLQTVQPAKEKPFLTEEGDKLILSKAYFDVKNFAQVFESLNREYDFLLEKAEKNKRAEFTWLRRGKSKEWKVNVAPKKVGIVIKSEVIHHTGEIKWSALGNITVTPKQLILECISKERLERGKARLKEILKGLIRHRVDSFEEARIPQKEGLREREEERKISEQERLILEKEIREYYNDWVSQPNPSLGGMTPLEAIKTDQGREMVIELLKNIENTEERKKKEGFPYFDVSILKKKLGI